MDNHNYWSCFIFYLLLTVASFSIAEEEPEPITEAECLEYLNTYMPESDRKSPNITKDFLIQNIQLALQARNSTPWGKTVPKAIFLNDVLPYAVLSEPRGVPDWNWRPEFFSKYLPLVRNMNMSSASEAGMNTLGWAIVNPPIQFKGSPNCQVNAYAPMSILKAHEASCTGLAVFLALALRSISIPARVAGVPHWNRCGGRGKTCAMCPHGDLCTPGDKSSDDACGNHDWVEVWVDGAWHFMDPDGSKKLDDGWFVDNTKLQTVHEGTYLNHSILASSWAPTNTLPADLYPHSISVSHFAMVWDWSNTEIGGWDVTPRYLMNTTHFKTF
eukprot:m.145564 g.145564  ORF g.145564 m.145564 type:complete len:329 (+) comp14949_c0_seq2:161-1147(+)